MSLNQAIPDWAVRPAAKTQNMKSAAPLWIRQTASALHRIAAGCPPIARLYLAFWRFVGKRFSPLRRTQLLNSLSSITWPENVLEPQTVVLGADTPVKLHPHNGEFDFAAVLGGHLLYEQEVFHFIDSRIHQYDAVIEIGANVGVFTVYFGKRLQQTGGRVYAFEPSRRAFVRLAQNLTVNNLPNVSCFGVAVGAETGFLSFHEPEGHLTNGSLVSEFAANFSSKVMSAPVVVLGAATLVGLLQPGKRVLLKIVVEGFEALLITALAPLFEQLRPDVLLEVLPEYEAAIDAAVRSSAVNYQRFAITPQGLQQQDTLHAVGGRDCFLVPFENVSVP